MRAGAFLPTALLAGVPGVDLREAARTGAFTTTVLTAAVAGDLAGALETVLALAPGPALAAGLRLGAAFAVFSARATASAAFTAFLAALLRRNLLVYGLGGVLVPFVGIKAIDLLLAAAGLA